jgi:hypothetical protein
MRGTLYTFSTIREHSSHFKTCPSNIWLSLAAVVVVMVQAAVAVLADTVAQLLVRTQVVEHQQKHASSLHLALLTR